jgi:hypothetical protein
MPNFHHQEVFRQYEMTLNYMMMVERYPNLKEEVDGSMPGYEISSLLDRKLVGWSIASCALVLACRPSISKKRKKRKEKKKFLDTTTSRVFWSSCFFLFYFKSHTYNYSVNGQPALISPKLGTHKIILGRREYEIQTRVMRKVSIASIWIC